MSTTNLKSIAADVVAVGSAISAVLAVVVNVAPSVSIPAPEVALIIGVSSIITAIVNVLRPFAVSVAKTLFKP